LRGVPLLWSLTGCGTAFRREPFLGGGVFEDAKLEWVTEKVVLRHMTRGATGVESSGKDRLKRRRMSLNIELGCNLLTITLNIMFFK
jgi:hypothetical protein